MSERNHYDAGAIHNDHHKEINIGTVSESVLKDLISNFFKDDAEDAEYEEVTGNEVVDPVQGIADNVPAGNETPKPKLVVPESEVAKCFKFTYDFVKLKVADIIRDYYKGSYANLALIEITLFDHKQLNRRNSHKAFVRALIAWGLLEVADEEELKKIVSAVTDKHNRLNRISREGYKKWGDDHPDKSICEKIGRDLGDSMPYNG